MRKKFKSFTGRLHHVVLTRIFLKFVPLHFHFHGQKPRSHRPHLHSKYLCPTSFNLCHKRDPKWGTTQGTCATFLGTVHVLILPEWFGMLVNSISLHLHEAWKSGSCFGLGLKKHFKKTVTKLETNQTVEVCAGRKGMNRIRKTGHLFDILGTGNS